MNPALLATTQVEHHTVTELPFASIWFGVIALAVFLAMLGLLWSFRNTLTLEAVSHDGTHGDPDSSPDTGRSGRL